jgi:hypothetical protein
MKIEELAELMGKSVSEVQDMLKKDDVIELNLSERSTRARRANDKLRIME